MKRRSLLAALLGAGLVAAGLLGTAPQPSLAQDRPVDPVAIAETLEGQVYLLRQGRQIPLERNMAVADTDEVLTFPDAKVRLRFADGTLVTIGPRSRCLVAFQRRDPNQEDDFLELIEGILRVFTAEAGRDNLKVRTHSAIAVPRGTEWIVERKPGSTGVFVIDGRVSVTGAGNAMVLLAPGEGTDVPNGAPPQPVKRWGQARVDDVLARTTLR